MIDDAPICYDAAPGDDLDVVDRLLVRCARVVAASRARRHPEPEALAAGFDAQVAEPVEADDLEQRLVGILRGTA